MTIDLHSSRCRHSEVSLMPPPIPKLLNIKMCIGGYVSVISAPGHLRQKDLQFEASIDYPVTRQNYLSFNPLQKKTITSPLGWREDRIFTINTEAILP